MIKVIAFALLALWFCALGAHANGHTPALDDDQRFTRLTAPVDEELDDAEASEIRAERFKALWSDHDYATGLAGASDDAVKLRVRAARDTTFAKPVDWVLERYRSALDEAHRRGIANPEQFRGLFDAYLAASRPEQAEGFVESYPELDLPAVPETVPPGEPPSSSAHTLWRVADEPIRLEGFHLELSGPKLLVVSSPGCGFCRMAARALPEDELLGPLMREHAVWLSQKSLNNTYQRILGFNREYPEAQHFFVDDPAEWPVSTFRAFPEFTFVVDGQVRETLFGWRGGSEAMWAIARGFESIGLLDAGALPPDVFAYADDEKSATDHCPTREQAWAEIIDGAAITNREALDTHLAELSEGGDSPLLALSSEARKRLVDSIRFGSRGTSGFRLDDVRAQLSPLEIYAVASLFGLQVFYAGMFFPVELLSERDRQLKAMYECSEEYAPEERSGV
ncbi:hypothetical protein [Roseovarius sp.]|uniref:hypothetical protein n=1 Tax=Roseovarius sp. TaxID=1486281 RepID=UPI0035693832